MWKMYMFLFMGFNWASSIVNDQPQAVQATSCWLVQIQMGTFENLHLFRFLSIYVLEFPTQIKKVGGS